MTGHTMNSSAHASGLLSARPQRIAQPFGREPGRHALGLEAERDGAFFVPEQLDAARPVPLIVGLHGAGGIASQMIDLFAGPAATRGVIVLAPESRSSTWDVIQGGYGPDVAFIDRALQRIFELHPIDPERIAIAGFSDGASYALSIGVINGALFNDILAFSPGFMAPTQTADSPRIFVSHGLHDEVLPIEPCSRRIVPALQNAGYDVEYLEFAGGHIAPPDIVGRALDRFLD